MLRQTEARAPAHCDAPVGQSANDALGTSPRVREDERRLARDRLEIVRRERAHETLAPRGDRPPRVRSEIPRGDRGRGARVRAWAPGIAMRAQRGDAVAPRDHVAHAKTGRGEDLR